MNQDPTISESCRLIAEFEDDAATSTPAPPAVIPVSSALVLPLPDAAGLHAYLDGLALTLADKDDLEEALRQLQQQAETCRRGSDPKGRAIFLAGQAHVLAFHLGQPRPALPLIEEAHQLAVRHGLALLAREIQPILDNIHRQTGV
jgi:hypothetical protein